LVSMGDPAAVAFRAWFEETFGDKLGG
jgi:hypothetical protein